MSKWFVWFPLKVLAWALALVGCVALGFDSHDRSAADAACPN